MLGPDIDKLTLKMTSFGFFNISSLKSHSWPRPVQKLKDWMHVGEYWPSNTSDFVKYMYITNKHIVKKKMWGKNVHYIIHRLKLKFLDKKILRGWYSVFLKLVYAQTHALQVADEFVIDFVDFHAIGILLSKAFESQATATHAFLEEFFKEWPKFERKKN